tara:strand:+ start:564 stop:1121 length:558 start_codon:yes stop_codon:yes gene_type:complete
MESSRRNNKNNYFEIGNLDKKVDQFLEAGRQFVDGVSGTRPGSRRRNSLSRFSSANVKDVGRWISNQVDSIIDDDELDEWYEEDKSKNQFKSFRRTIDADSKKENFLQKKPLEAKSLRDLNESLMIKPARLLTSRDDWPEESDFKVNKWQRSTHDQEEINFEKNSEYSRRPKTKSFPKSRRRRRI